MAYARAKIRVKKWKERPADETDRPLREREMMEFVAFPLHVNKTSIPVSTISPIWGSLVTNFPELGKVGGIFPLLSQKSPNLVAFNRLLRGFSGTLTKIWDNLPSVDKISSTCSRELLALVDISQSALTTSVLYVGWRKRLPFCRFLGGNFVSKSYQQKWQFGGSYLRRLTYQTYLNPYPARDSLASTDIREHY